jgi:hypothetical protein
LHSLGSLAGAAVGSFYPRDRTTPMEKGRPITLGEDEIDEPVTRAPVRPSAKEIYWLATLGVAVLLSLIWIRSSEALLGLALFLPLIQLGGSVLCALLIAAHPDQRREARAWKRLGWITLGTVGGCVIGILIMVALVGGWK